MNDQVIGLVGDSKALNSKIVSLPRLLILASLENLDEDGATYRELKAGLEMDDGILYSNLKALEAMGYLIEREIKLGKKKMASYCITDEGKQAFNAVKRWFKAWLRG